MRATSNKAGYVELDFRVASMTAWECSPCDRLEPCGCCAWGYAAGRDKAFFEVLASLDGPAHAEDSGSGSARSNGPAAGRPSP